jgi:hypothetical protein
MTLSRFAFWLILFVLQTFVSPAQETARYRRILIDEAHHNLFATASGGYAPFVQVIREVGFSVTRNLVPFEPQRLEATDILLIANPRAAPETAPAERQIESAFLNSELDVVQ